MHCFNFFRSKLWQHLISCNSFRNVKMCLSEAAISKNAEAAISSCSRGVKCLRTGEGGGGEGSAPHYMPWNTTKLTQFLRLLRYSQDICKQQRWILLQKFPSYMFVGVLAMLLIWVFAIIYYTVMVIYIGRCSLEECIYCYFWLLLHCTELVQIRSFFWSVFSHLWTEYCGKMGK